MTSAPGASNVLDASVGPVNIDQSQLKGSLRKGNGDKDSNCWNSPSGMGFMIRGKTYLKDNAKVTLNSCIYFNIFTVDAIHHLK